MIQADPDPARVRPEGYAANQASINNLGGTEGWTAGQWPPYGTFGDYRMGIDAAMMGGPLWPIVENSTGGFITPPGRPSELEPRPTVTPEVSQESLQDHNPSQERPRGMPGGQNNFPGVGTFDPLQVGSRQVSPSIDRSFLFEPAVNPKTLEEQLFAKILQAGNV